MAAHRFVEGADGTRIAVHTAGLSGAPTVLLVHGWAQSARCWHRQLDDGALTAECRVAAVDLRGHGCSDAPPDGYDDLGDDLHAVITALTRDGSDSTSSGGTSSGGTSSGGTSSGGTSSGGGPSAGVDSTGAGGVRRAVLVGWSYGGLVIADYLARHGTGAVAGVLLTGAITGIGRGVAAGRVGPAMRAALPGALADDPKVAVPALSAFIAAMPARPLDGPQEQALLAAALATPPRVRAALFDRRRDGAPFVDALTRAPVPVLVQHGTQDRVVDPATAEHHLATVPGAEADWWPGGGHLTFAEDAPRFDRTLLSFVRQRVADRERMAR